jgi:hypothetical protein
LSSYLTKCNASKHISLDHLCFSFIKNLLFWWGVGVKGGLLGGFFWVTWDICIIFQGFGFRVSRFDGIGPHFQHDLRYYKTQGIPKVLCIF